MRGRGVQLKALLAGGGEVLQGEAFDCVATTAVRGWVVQHAALRPEVAKEAEQLVPLIESPVNQFESRLLLAGVGLGVASEEKEEAENASTPGAPSASATSAFAQNQLRVCAQIAENLNSEDMLVRCLESAQALEGSQIKEAIHLKLANLRRARKTADSQ